MNPKRCPKPDDQHAAELDEQDNPPWPPSAAKTGDVWGAYRLESDGWWRLAPLEWIDRKLGQLGIDVRQSKHHIQMRYYLELLKEEIGMTERFLSEDATDG